MVNSVNNTFVLQDQPQRFIFSHFYKLLWGLSLSRMLVEFSLKLVYSVMCGKNFLIYAVHIPRKCIESSFYSCLPPNLKLSPNFLSLHPRQSRGKLPIPPASIFSKTCLLQQQKGVDKTMIQM